MRAARMSITGSLTSGQAGGTTRSVPKVARAVGARPLVITQIRRLSCKRRAMDHEGLDHIARRQTHRRRVGSECQVHRARPTTNMRPTAHQFHRRGRRVITRSPDLSMPTSTTLPRPFTRHHLTRPSRRPHRGPTHPRRKGRTIRAVDQRPCSHPHLRRSTVTRTAPPRPTRTKAPALTRPLPCRTPRSRGRPTRPTAMRPRRAPSTVARLVAPVANRSRAHSCARSTRSTTSTAFAAR